MGFTVIKEKWRISEEAEWGNDFLTQHDGQNYEKTAGDGIDVV